jgi:hypothetical protein
MTTDDKKDTQISELRSEVADLQKSRGLRNFALAKLLSRCHQQLLLRSRVFWNVLGLAGAVAIGIAWAVYH